jgi:hypothetical protein
VQPTRLALQAIKEISSQLNALGIELCNREFVSGTMGVCRKKLAVVYDEIGHVSADAALQVLADVVFLEIALAGGDEFQSVKEKLVERVCLMELLIVVQC